MTTRTPVAEQVATLETQLNAAYFERRDAIRGILLAVLSGEHAFLLGPPGTAKSQLVRAVVDTISGARYFEVGLSKQRPAEAVLGPLDIPRFKQGEYVLKREGYATQVEFAFFDEIGKMSPILGHDLLALLNERLYHEVANGRSQHTAPLSTAFCASNEWLTDESEDAAALEDRLLIRLVVDYISDDDNFAALLRGSFGAVDVDIDWTELQAAIVADVPALPISDDAMTGILSLRRELARNHIYPSDRRWRASMNVLRANAYLEGRDAVAEDDITALRFTLWSSLEQMDLVHRLCKSASNPFLDKLLTIGDSVAEIERELVERLGAGSDEATLSRNRAWAKEAINKLRSAHNEFATLGMEAAGRTIPGYDDAVANNRRVLVDCLQGLLAVPDRAAAEATATKVLASGSNVTF